ncbi:MAG TPA: hypothetical protein VF712_12610 [Thermoleophilaceae bacterium]
MFAAYLVVIALGIAAAIAIGLVRNGDDAEAGATVERFSSAVRGDDGEGACALLPLRRASSSRSRRAPAVRRRSSS